MKQKEAVKLTLEELDRQAQEKQAEKDREEMEDRQDNARPFLIKRIGVGLLDFVFMLVIAAASFFFADFVFFDAVGYNDASDYIIRTYTESGLFISENGSFKQLPERYDEEQDLILYYDAPITNFYKTNQKAISENKLESYNQAKLDSNYFIVNELNEIVRKEGVSNVNLQNFLENKYTEAYNLFIDNNDLNLATQKMFNTITFTILISTTIGAGIIYIIIPLLDSKKRTLGYMIGGLIAVNVNNMSILSNKKMLIRNSVFAVSTYILAVTLYILTGTVIYSTILFFINTFMMCLTRSNSGFHDIVAEATVINKSLSNPFSNLKAINDMKGEK